jgi:hypothetical protein
MPAVFERSRAYHSDATREMCLQELEERKKVIPLAPYATSCRMGWKNMQAIDYRRTPASGELSLPPVSLHQITLTLRPPEKWDLRYEGVRRDAPPPAVRYTWCQPEVPCCVVGRGA